MRKVLTSWTTKMVGCGICLVLLASSADARLERFRDYVANVLPGIDANGNVDFGNTADASIKLTWNTRVERALLQARGNVDNQSRRKFKAEDTFVGQQVQGLTVVSDVYTVSPRGSASFTARAYSL